jgi:predicted permease
VKTTRGGPRRAFGNNLRSLRRWRDAGRDVRDEIAMHVDLRARDLEAAGLPPDEARAQAEREVGAPDRVAPAVDALATRADRASALRQRLDEIVQDVRYGLRAFRRAPGFTAVAILTIALGLGANAAIFGVVNVAFLLPLPFDPDGTLVRVREYRVGPDGSQRHVDASRRTADAVAARPDLFTDSVPVAYVSLALARDDGAMRVAATRVGPRFTAVIGIAPGTGRTFTEDEEHSAAGVALVSHRLAQTLFGGAGAALGQTLRLDRRPVVVVGVLPPSFHVPYESDLWLPDRFGENERGIFLLARRVPAVSLEQVRAALEPMGVRLRAEYPDVMLGLGVTAVELREYFVDDQDRVALALMGAVAFLLLIACTNVALLLTTRFAARHREVAVRAALGCGRRRQVRQFVTEGLVLFLTGGAAGVLLALWLRDSLVVFIPDAIATQVGIEGIPIDWRLAGVSAGVSIAAGVAFGLIAALRTTRVDLNGVMTSDGRSIAGAASRGTLGGLVIGEVALALVLLTAAGVMLDSFRRLQDRDLGFRPDGVLTMRLDLTAERYASPDARRSFVDRLLERTRALPGVAVAGVTTVNPLCCGNWGARVTLDGRPPAPEEPTPVVQHFIVTPGYFAALGQPVVRGRDFTPADVDGAERTAIVDEGFADRFWPGEDPLGKRVKAGPADSPRPWLTVVGVVSSAVQEGEYTESWYLPHAQNAGMPSSDNAHLMLRATAGDTASLTPQVRAIGADLDPHLPLYAITTMDALVAQSLEQDRLGAMVTALFAAAGLLLAALGIYGVLSFVVGAETREIGVRVALGASRADVLTLVTGRAARLVAIGLVIGCGASWAASQLFSALLESARVDLRIVGAAAAVLIAAGLLAALIPARRALRLDPLRALRAE